MRRATLLVCLLALQGCSAFSAVRSAEVVPGRSIDIGLTLATPPGEEAIWFWLYDCPSDCDRHVPSIDVSFTRGVVPEGDGHPYAVGAGLSGFFPYAHGYVQLKRAPHPFGLGGRAGVSLLGWFEVAAFARQDIELGDEARLLLSPTLFHHTGNSPNGANPGSFTAFAQGVGLQIDAGSTSITPSVLAVWGRVDRRSYGTPIRANTAFLVMGVSVGLGR